MTEETPSENPYLVTEEDIKSAYSIPATHVNRFVVNWDTAGARITFSEQNAVGGDAHPRVAVAMAIPSLISLYELLRKVLKDSNLLSSEEQRNG